MLIYTFLAGTVVDTGNCRSGGCTALLGVSCKEGGMSGVCTSDMNDDVHIIAHFIHYGFGYQHTLFCIKKKTFSGTAAHIHLFYTLFAKISGYGFYGIHIDGTIFFERCVEGDCYVTKSVCLIL